LYPFILCVFYDTLHTACIRHPFRSTSSVKSYLRSNLTADSRTSPVPAMFHFFILFYYFHLQMFERFMNYIVPFHIVCLLRYTPSGAHPVCIRHTIRRISCLHPGVYPVYIRRAPGVHSFLSSSVKSYLRYNLTADYRTSLVPAILHFYFHFYYFHLQMFERFMICIVSFHIVCLLRYTTSDIHPAFIRCSSDIHPAFILYVSWCVSSVYVLSMSCLYPTFIRHPVLSIIFGQILPSV
jgi:hypothetical protein